MKPLLKLLVVILILGAIGGLIALAVSSPSFLNWFFAAVVGCIAAFFGTWLLGLIMQIFTVGDEKFEAVVYIFLIIVGIGAAIYLTIFLHQHMILF